MMVIIKEYKQHFDIELIDLFFPVFVKESGTSDVFLVQLHIFENLRMKSLTIKLRLMICRGLSSA